MAITVNALNVYPAGWAVNGTSADASGCEELRAAPGAANSLYLTGVIISSDTALTVTIGAGETGGAVTAALLGPIAIAANQTLPWKFDKAVMVGTNAALVVDASGAGVVTVYAEGFTDVTRVPA